MIAALLSAKAEELIAADLRFSEVCAPSHLDIRISAGSNAARGRIYVSQRDPLGDTGRFEEMAHACFLDCAQFSAVGAPFCGALDVPGTH